MTCRELIEFLMDYLDGALDPEQRRVFEEHLGCCPPCVEYLESYRETVRLGQQAMRCDEETAALPPGMPERLLDAVRKARKLAEDG